MRTRDRAHSAKNDSRIGRAGKVTFVIMSPCVGIKDGTCVDVCPVDCIHEGETMFYIDPVECIACALCETICPVDAIRHIDEVPEEEKVTSR
jgi:ferredoxin